MSVLIFLAVLFVLILVHEWGHYITAKWTGMRVDEFGIGFPPKLWSFRRGETLYTLNALPLGGFVKILGENGEEDGVALSEADRARTFGARPKWAQALVLVAGVTMNVLFAWVLLFGLLLVGVPAAVGEDTATPAATLLISEVLPESPAAVLPAQATVIAVERGGTSLTTLTPSAVSDFVAQSGEAVTVRYVTVRGEEAEAVVTPVQGLIASDADRYAMGVGLVLVEATRYGVLAAVSEATRQTVSMTAGITVGLYQLLANAVAGTADFSQVAGPVGIVEHVGNAASVGLTSLVLFTAIISLNLAVINLLPVPALDGGRLVFVAIEAVTRRPIPAVWAGRMNLVGFGLLMLLMVVVTYNDIMKLF